MKCLECGNCKGDELTYYCTAKNGFVIKEVLNVREKERSSNAWKKGDPGYETRRRTYRGDREPVKTG